MPHPLAHLRACFTALWGQAGPLAAFMVLVLQEAVPWCGSLGQGSEVKALPLC